MIYFNIFILYINFHFLCTTLYEVCANEDIYIYILI